MSEENGPPEDGDAGDSVTGPGDGEATEPKAEEPPAHPKLRSIRGGGFIPKSPGRWGAPLDFATYERLWVLYRDGERGLRALCRASGVGMRAVSRAVKRGWPDRQMAPLAERAKLADRQRVEDEARMSSEAFRVQVDQFYAARKRNLGYLAGASGLAGAILRKIHQAAQSATFTRYRSVKKLVDGEAVTVDEAYVPAHDVVQALRSTASAIRDLGQYERIWLSATVAGTAPGTAEAMRTAAPLTTEQIQYILENDGALPDGCTDEQVLATLANLTAPMDKKVPGKS